MADINLERKRGGGGWIVGLLALIALALVIWWVWPDDDDDDLYDDTAMVTSVEPATTPVEPETAPAPTLAAVLANPGAYVGQDFPAGEVTVAEVPTDRGFWIEHAGDRLFAIIVDDPQEQPLDINPGQTLQIDGGTLRAPGAIGSLPGTGLDADTEALANEQEAFLVVNESAIRILTAG